MFVGGSVEEYERRLTKVVLKQAPMSRMSALAKIAEIMNTRIDYQATASDDGKPEWLTGSDGTKHFLRIWQAESPKACLLYFHGIEGHSLWFKNTAVYLKMHGITTFAADRRGSGMSPENTGDIESYKLLVQDAREYISFARGKAAQAPLFLMANCWGAKLAALVCQVESKESELLDGLILSSPAIEAKVDLPFLEKLLILIRFIIGNTRRIDLPLEVEDFTDNPIFQEFIRQDNYRLTQASSRFLVNSFILTLLSKETAEKISMPTLVLQSGQDDIVNLSGTEHWFAKLKSVNKTLQVFKGMKHSLDFSANPDEYRETLLNWVLNLSQKQTSTRSESSRENSLA